jgi:hypothetical protein
MKVCAAPVVAGPEDKEARQCRASFEKALMWLILPVGQAQASTGAARAASASSDNAMNRMRFLLRVRAPFQSYAITRSS